MKTGKHLSAFKSTLWLVGLWGCLCFVWADVEPPLASPLSGTQFVGTLPVSLSNPTTPGALIYYTLDGTDPNTSCVLFDNTSPIVISDLTILKAVSFDPDDLGEPSAIVTFFYIPKAAKPVVDIGDTTFFSSLDLNLNTQTVGAQIFYSLDGSNPTNEYAGGITVTQTAMLKAVAVRDGWAPSDTSYSLYVKQVIEIQNGAGTPVSYLTEADSFFTLAFQAQVQGLGELEVVSLSLNNSDLDTLLLNATGQMGGYTVFEGNFPLGIGTSPLINDGMVSASPYDSLWFYWTNPQDPSEQLGGLIHVRPAPRASNMYFVDVGLNPISSMAGNENKVYVILEDQLFNPSQLYQARFSNRRGGNTSGSLDLVVANYTEISPGRYLFSVPVEIGQVNTADQILQLMSEDEILVSYLDPVDGDFVVREISFGQPTFLSQKADFLESVAFEVRRDGQVVRTLPVRVNGEEETAVYIYDLSGKTVYAGHIHASRSSMNYWETRGRGTYILRTAGSSGPSHFKFQL